MSELVFPHSIDAGTAMVANEVQSNFEAVADVVNGNLQGGSGSDGNLAANGVTARELADLIMKSGLPPYGAREGLVTQPTGTTQAMYVSPGAGLVLNYGGGTAWVRDDSGVLAAGALIPVVVSASTVTVAANSSGNPRLDQIILTMTGYGTGTVSVLQGTPNAATTLDNRTGAASLPDDSIRLADVLMTNGFAGPFVDHTSLRNRIPWAVPMTFTASGAAEVSFVIDSQTQELVDIQHQLEVTGFPTLAWQAEGVTSGSYGVSADEAQLISSGAVARATRGGWSLTAGNLNIAPTGVGAGGLKYQGRSLLSTKIVSNNWLTLTGDASASSLTGSGNHVLSSYHISSVLSPGSGGVYSWMRIFIATNAFTGHFVVDRVPMV